jgi:ketosteroid isomerase-like protein
MTPDTAEAFARHWLQAWNDHDLEAILSHYADDVVFLSPVAQRRVDTGRVVGIAALRDYWRQGLEAQPALRFERLELLLGHDGLTLLYRNHRGQTVAETFEFGSDGKVVRACACYAP